MKTYVLIVWLFWQGYPGGVATAEFWTPETCAAAAKAIEGNGVKAVCVKK